MASISSCQTPVSLRIQSPSQTNRLLPTHCSPIRFPPRAPPFQSLRASARRRTTTNPTTTSSKKKKSILPPKKDEEEEVDEDAIEALFSQLEEDLKNDELSIDEDDEEMSEEDLARLERELEEALGEDDELLELFNSAANELETDDNVEESDDADDDEKEIPAKLKNWQVRRLASALKLGRRKTSIKSLAEELCLERAVVLELLRDPPPNLLLMSAALPDKPVTPLLVHEPKPLPLEITTDAEEPEKAKVKEAVHVMQSRWSAQKRLKKVHVETLERVYRRTKRPTNAMVSSIVQVTNLPRKRIVKWFEDKRTEDGVPDQRTHRRPYERSASETVYTT